MSRVRVGELELSYDVDGDGPRVLMLMGLGGDRHGWDLPPAESLAVQAPWAFGPRFLGAPSPAVATLQERLRARGGIRSVPAYQRQVDACLAHDVLDALPRLPTPALLLAGADDVLTPVRYARAIVAALRDAEVVVLPEAGHACFLETPAAFVEHTRGFLARHPVVR